MVNVYKLIMPLLRVEDALKPYSLEQLSPGECKSIALLPVIR